MSQTSWNERYAVGEPLPWDTGTPDPQLVEMVESGAIVPGRALEIGCGTGTNAIFLAQHGFNVLGVDISDIAVSKARAKAHDLCRFAVADFLEAPPAGDLFEFVFDRGCFHAFDDDSARARFAQNVAAKLVEGGLWLSLIGSTEGAAREEGPPRRSARDVMNAIEPSLEILELRSAEFTVLRAGAEVVVLPVAQARDPRAAFNSSLRIQTPVWLRSTNGRESNSGTMGPVAALCLIVDEYFRRIHVLAHVVHSRACRARVGQQFTHISPRAGTGPGPRAWRSA